MATFNANLQAVSSGILSPRVAVPLDLPMHSVVHRSLAGWAKAIQYDFGGELAGVTPT